MLNTTTLIDNYQLLELLGLIEPVGEFVRLSDQALVLRDSVAFEDMCYSAFPIGTKIFALNRIIRNGDGLLNREGLKAVLQQYPYLKYLRVFFAKFKPDENGRITQKADKWDKLKGWRYDIDVVKDEDLEKDKESAIQRIIDKERDILALIDKLPLIPNILKRSNKGWHLIYVFDEFITRDAYDTYLKRYNKPGDKPDDDITDQFTVFELISEHIPKYLIELDPQLDYQASSKISSIATRFITDELPAYLLHDPYSLREFRKAFEHLIYTKNTKRDVKDVDIKDVDVKEEVVYKQGKVPYTVKDIPKTTFLSLIDRCGVLKALDEDWENHTEYEWYVMTNYYAIRILYADTPEEAEKLRQEFHDKSSRWIGNGNKRYTYNEAERQLEYYIRKQEEGLKPPTCKYIYHNLSSKYTTICHTCPYRKFDPQGNMIANFVFDGLKSDSLEDVKIPGWELREDGWYMELSGKDSLESVWIRVLPYFKIRAYYLVGGETFTELIDIVDNKGISTIHRIERKKDTLYVNPADLIVPYGRFKAGWAREIKAFLTDYIEEVKEKRGVKIKFLGYLYANGVWDIAVGGYENYRRKDVSYIFYGQETDEDWFVPSIQGSLETFKDIYRHAFLLDDPTLHLAIAHYLSWIGFQFIKHKQLKARINPVLIFVGDTGTGKSTRAKIAAGLYGNPALFSFTNITEATYTNRFPLIKTPFGIDEVKTRKELGEEKLSNLIYNIGNKGGKMTSYAMYDPIKVPVIITGETESLLIDKMFNTNRGIVRRSIVIKMTTKYEDNADTLDYLLDELDDNYGHILTYIKSLTDEDRKLIVDYGMKILDWQLNFGGSTFKELRKHLALSLAMFKHFYKYFIGISEDEIEKKVNQIIEFVSKEASENQLHRIGDSINYVDEVLEFITSVKKAEKEGFVLTGLSYKGVIMKIGYKPSNRIEPLLKKFFWKKYSYGSGTNYHFRDTSVLLDNLCSAAQCAEETEIMFYNFTKDDMAIWLKVAEARYGKEKLDSIKAQLLTNARPSKQELLEKFPELKQS
jgi:Domain of unknown function (DUF927).